MCLAVEVTKPQLKDLDKQEQQETVHEIKQAKNIRRKRDRPDRPVTKRFTANRNSRPCRYCGEIHKAGRWENSAPHVERGIILPMSACKRTVEEHKPIVFQKTFMRAQANRITWDA